MGEREDLMDGWSSMRSGVFIVKGFGWKITRKSLKRPYKGGLFYHGFGIHSFGIHSFTNAYPHDSWSKVNGQRSMVNGQRSMVKLPKYP